ncbi:MAG: type I citrate synthase [Chloroflexi bacterium RBG_16_52_11]|nr:MAG: type I citrate synthase [Chloroflexi bacterium RBG_16_52_11]
MKLQDKMTKILPDWQARVARLLRESGDLVVDEVTISQIYGGMRNIKSLVTDISFVDPNEGIRLRGYTIPEILEELPKLPGAEIPLVGGLYYLFLTDEFPDLEQAMEIENEWKARADVPQFVFDVLKSMPRDSHPMMLFSQAILSLQYQSVFAKRYQEGMKREEYWIPMLEDSLNLTAKLPAIAAYIYNLKYKDGQFISPDLNLDWGANYAHMMGISSPQYKELSRLYFILHSDHESGNASAHATHLAASTLSDIYYAFSAGINSLAGPLHGLANQECLDWLLEIYKKFRGVPSEEEIEQFAWDTLNKGQVIPGYGHAVLRKPDPRFTALFKFGLNYLADDPIFRVAQQVNQIVPDVLMAHGRAKNPWPNVDAISGTLQYHYGVREFDFYTVLFGVGRALGVSANAVWARALGQPLERPKSVTTKMLEEIAEKNKIVQ